ncbi:MAG: hypothetical protein AAGE01_19735 [Pseudomonadota bacterium]
MAAMDEARRNFLVRAASLLAMATAAGLAAAVPAAGRRPAALDRLFVRVNEECRDLKVGALSAPAWQDALADLFRNVPPEDLARFIDLDGTAAAMALPDRGVETRIVSLPRIDFGGEVQHFRKVFGMRRGRAIIPHGHRNMVSCHFVLRGSCRLRQYDVVDRSDPSEWIISPAVDRVAAPGDLSSIFDERHNVHWLIAREEPTWLFDVIVLDVGTLPGKAYEVFNLDPDAGRFGPDGLAVPVIPVDEGLARYGAAS